MNDERPSILVIDDTPANLLMLGSVLEPDFKLQIATSGAMGLSLAGKSPPDLILLDVMMPEMDGYETCRRLKADPRLKNIPVIFVTALTDSTAEASGLALGAADFITKPVNVEIARHRIRNLVERERLGHEVEAQRDLLRDLYNSLQDAREEERYHFARELHDNLGHLITALGMDLDWLDGRLHPTEPRVSAKLATLRTQLDQIVDTVRNLMEDMRPGMLDTLGLDVALENYVDKFAARTGIRAKLTTPDVTIDVGQKIAIGIFRIVQEALNNVSRHAAASEVSVQLFKSGNEIVLAVEDNGHGLPEAHKLRGKGFGILGMRERVQILSGQFTMTSEPGKGVRIEAHLPI